MTSRVDLRQALRSLGALLALGCLLIGVPAALANAVGWPLPSAAPPLDRVVDALGGSSIDDRTIVKGLALVCWLAWAQILLSTVVEIAAWHTGRVASRLPAVPLQALTRRLVLSALLLGASVRTAAVPPNLALASVEAPVFVAPVADVVSHAPPAPTLHPTPSALVGMVHQRDCLWRLAENHLGDGLRWRELWELNRGREFPDGRVFQDPDLIHPGWALLFPADAVGLDAPPSAEVPATSTPPTPEPSPRSESPPFNEAVTPPTVEPPSTTEVTAPSDTAVASPIEELSDEGTDDDEGVVPIGLAAGGIIAAGLLGAVRRQQRARQRRRSPGHEAWQPTHATTAAEAGLRRLAVDEPVERLDSALRALARAISSRRSGHPPAVDVVSVADDGAVEVLLSSPLQGAPSVFEVTAGGMAWTLPPDADPVALHRAASGQAAPCPALVEVGTIDGRSLLVDLESPSSTVIVGDAAAARRLLLSLTYGLATTTYADDLHLIWVGPPPPGVANLDRVQVATDVHEVMPQLEKIASATSEAMALGSWPTALSARVSNPADAWTPTIVVVPDDSTEALAPICRPDTGIACVALRSTEEGAGRVLRCVSDEVIVEPLGLRLQAAALPESVLFAAGDLIDELAGDAPGPEMQLEAEVSAAAESEPRAEVAALRLPLDVGEDDDVINVRVLGPVEVSGGARKIDRRRSEELVVYLALHHDGVDEGRLKAALWHDDAPTSHTFNQTVSRARSCLGPAADGSFHLPHCQDGLYRVGDRVTSDYRALVSALRAASDDATSDALEELAAALESVRGLPFEGTKRGWEWIFNEGLSAHITSVVSEAAHLLATHAIELGDAKRAIWATVQGAKASPGDEILYRDRMLAHDLEGNPAGVEAAMDELMRVIEADEPDGNVHPETMDLYERLSRHRRTG
jgi:hypothetical protein